MRKTFAVLIVALVILLCMSSCSKMQDICYYGYFSDSACMILYSADKNTVYDIKLPLRTIISWGLEQGIENIPNAIRSFMGINETEFMYGSPETFKALCAINAALENNREALKDPVLLANIKKICSADFTALGKVVSECRPGLFQMDASGFADGMDLESSKRYYNNWIRQVVGE